MVILEWNVVFLPVGGALFGVQVVLVFLHQEFIGVLAVMGTFEEFDSGLGHIGDDSLYLDQLVQEMSLQSSGSKGVVPHVASEIDAHFEGLLEIELHPNFFLDQLDNAALQSLDGFDGLVEHEREEDFVVSPEVVQVELEDLEVVQILGHFLDLFLVLFNLENSVKTRLVDVNSFLVVFFDDHVYYLLEQQKREPP